MGVKPLPIGSLSPNLINKDNPVSHDCIQGKARIPSHLGCKKETGKITSIVDAILSFETNIETATDFVPSRKLAVRTLKAKMGLQDEPFKFGPFKASYPLH